MNTTDFAIKLKIEMDAIKNALVEPSAPDFTKYKEMVSRYHALKWAHEQLRLSTAEEDKE